MARGKINFKKMGRKISHGVTKTTNVVAKGTTKTLNQIDRRVVKFGDGVKDTVDNVVNTGGDVITGLGQSLTNPGLLLVIGLVVVGGLVVSRS